MPDKPNGFARQYLVEFFDCDPLQPSDFPVFFDSLLKVFTPAQYREDFRRTAEQYAAMMLSSGDSEITGRWLCPRRRVCLDIFTFNRKENFYGLLNNLKRQLNARHFMVMEISRGWEEKNGASNRAGENFPQE